MYSRTVLAVPRWLNNCCIMQILPLLCRQGSLLLIELYSVQMMQLHTGAEHFGNVILQYSDLTSQYHNDASIDVYHM